MSGAGWAAPIVGHRHLIRLDARADREPSVHHIFQRFVDRLNESRDPEGFRTAMAEAAAAFDLTCFAYLTMPRNGGEPAALISSYPAPWTEHYLRERYEMVDPVVVLAHQQHEPFEWGLGADNFDMTPSQAQLFDEASEFGIRCGFTIPIQDGRGPIAAVTFASDARRAMFRHTIECNKSVLQLMAIMLHAFARQKLNTNQAIPGAQLSPRELECLRWSAEGKSAWEVGRILGVAERTVVFHIENAKRKLGVRTKCQAIALLGPRNA